MAAEPAPSPAGLTDPTVLWAGATARLAAGQLMEAVPLAKLALQGAPDDPRIAVLGRDVGLALFNASLWEDALPWLTRAAGQEPGNPVVRAALDRARLPDYLPAEVTDPRSGKRLERYSPREGDGYIYVIDVVGTCNLRCPTCPVGNTELRPRGFMDMPLFDQVLEKIRRESPSPSPVINLFNWGEPLLHPNLPEMIRRIKALGMRAHLSSNLNIKHGLAEVIAANPDELKISISGFSPETYSRTHARGNLELVKANMRAVRAEIDKSGATTRVWAGHHIYKTNQHEMAPLKAMCDELGFGYSPMAAFYMPLERVLENLEGRENPRDNGIVAELLRTPGEARAAAALGRSDRFDCELRFNQTVINHDGTVALCCTVYEAQNMLGVSFLDEDFAALEARKYEHSFCDRCIASGSQYVPAELEVITAHLQPAAVVDPT
ncbi:MAG: Radical domain protein [Phenylobacterium sp.]|nr:Radical domain protein [Phenylobacterium sp.]